MSAERRAPSAAEKNDFFKAAEKCKAENQYGALNPPRKFEQEAEKLQKRA